MTLKAKEQLQEALLLPLTFICSFFGHEFRYFGQGDLSIWIYFPTSVAVTAVCYLLWQLGGRRWRLKQFLR